MRFIANKLNGTYLDEIHGNAIDNTSEVNLAIAYASGSPRILQDCLERSIKLSFWVRYDSTGPVSLSILRKFLDRQSPNYVCRLVPDVFHPKVIWWRDYGAYIGSANLTERAWWGNVEAGVFLREDELAENGMMEELAGFFEDLDSLSHPLTDEVYKNLMDLSDSMDQIKKLRAKEQERFDQGRLLPLQPPLTLETKMSSGQRRREAFLREWNSTLTILRNIETKVSTPKNRPAWVESSVPAGVQADQFLHAYYYETVRTATEGSRHWEFHEENRSNPELAESKSMKWWAALESPPHDEDTMMYDWAPLVKEKTAKGVVRGLSKEEFAEVCARVHALRDHSLRVKHTTFGSSVPLPKMGQEERVRLLADYLYDRRNSKGRGILDTIYYVLWGGPEEDVPNRIFDAATREEWRIPHFGISSIGELVGWALPNTFPPRNGRTSKALVALGHKVRIHSE